VAGVLILEILGQNDIWVLASWPSIENIIRGKVVDSPKFGPWWVVWVHVCLWFVRASKCSSYTLTNLLFGLCKSMWVIDLLVNLPSPIPELQHGPLPSKCCEPGSAPQLPNSFSFCCLHLWTHSWVLQRDWGCVNLGTRDHPMMEGHFKKVFNQVKLLVEEEVSHIVGATTLAIVLVTNKTFLF